MAMTINELPAIAITFVVVGVVVAIGLAIETDVQDSLGESDCTAYWNTTSQACQVSESNATVFSANSEAYVAASDAIDGTAELSSKLPLIGLVIGFAIVLGVIGNFLYQRYA